MRAFPAKKISTYLAAVEEHGVFPVFYLELTTGIRRGGLGALCWTDQWRCIKVIQPKTANSVRTIYLPKETVDLLIREHAKCPGNLIMFPSPVTGKLYSPDCIRRLHKTILKKGGITENILFHGSRNTFAASAIQHPVHYSAGFTLDTYAHVTNEMQRKAAQ